MSYQVLSPADSSHDMSSRHDDNHLFILLGFVLDINIVLNIITGVCKYIIVLMKKMFGTYFHKWDSVVLHCPKTG